MESDNSKWRRLDYLVLIEKGTELNWLHARPKTQCYWDEAYQTFWILKNSPTDIWLRLKSL